MKTEVSLARCAGENNLAQAIEDKLNLGWTLLQVVFCGMGAIEEKLSISPRPTIVPMFLAVFEKRFHD